MAITASAFIAASLDGFIARTDGALDWLPQESLAGEDYGYAHFIAGVDTLVMGRGTFQAVLGFGEWPYGDRRVVVLSGTLEDSAVPATVRDRVSIAREEPRDLVAGLESEGARHLYVDGGRVIQSFLREGLLDRLILTRVPVLLGSGIPLFGPLPRDVGLAHVRTRSYETGLVQSEYTVLKGRVA